MVKSGVTVIVVDTSALIKRPSVIDELVDRFDEVIVPEIVIKELNGLKDSSEPSLRKKAWLIMVNIQKLQKRIVIVKSKKNNGKNDEKIVEIAKDRAKSSLTDKVYMFSNDIWFNFLTKDQSNLYPLINEEYEKQFRTIESGFDIAKTIEFYLLVKNKKLNDVKNFDLCNVAVNRTNAEDGLTPLICAVRNRDIKMLEYLVSLKGIDLDAKDEQKYKFSPLHHATQIKNMEIIKILIEAGADMDIGSSGINFGNTCLMIAAWSGFKECVEYLLSQGACANQQDNNGFTPLIKACIKMHYEIIKLLITKTDANIRSKENKKAIDYINPNQQNSDQMIVLFKERK